MTTTIERPGALPNLRRYLTTLLAGAYLLAWGMLGTRQQTASAERGFTEPTPDRRAQPVVIWYGDLAPSSRPPVQPPAGWHVAERAHAWSAPPSRPVPVRVSAARPRRIRTRSS